jgi:hypothetical protein
MECIISFLNSLKTLKYNLVKLKKKYNMCYVYNKHLGYNIHRRNN